MAADVTIDGSRGEGGGQILRTSLALSVITGRPVHLRKIRARRSKPGLRRQHLTAVKAAATICGGELNGDGLSSSAVSLIPGPVRPGDYSFRVGTAGSACLVLQTVLPALLCASGPSTVTVEGGTHNSMSPPFDFLQRCFLPLLARMGAVVDLSLERAGFYPAGGGRLRAVIQACEALQPLELMDRGQLRQRSARALLANLPDHIAERELTVVRQQLDWVEAETTVERMDKAKGPCNALMLEVGHDNVTELVTGFGEKGVPAETVAARTIAELQAYLASSAPVGEHLADQLMLPMALAGAGRYRTLPLSLHSKTNIETIQKFIDVDIHADEDDDGVVVSFGPG